MQIDKEHDAISPGRPSADRWQRGWRTGSSFSSLGLSFDSCWLIQGCLKKHGIVSLKDLSPIPQAPSSALRIGGRVLGESGLIGVMYILSHSQDAHIYRDKIGAHASMLQWANQGRLHWKACSVLIQKNRVNVLVNFLVCGWAAVRELRLSRWVLANSLSPDGLLRTELVPGQQHHPHLDAC